MESETSSLKLGAQKKWPQFVACFIAWTAPICMGFSIGYSSPGRMHCLLFLLMFNDGSLAPFARMYGAFVKRVDFVAKAQYNLLYFSNSSTGKTDAYWFGIEQTSDEFVCVIVSRWCIIWWTYCWHNYRKTRP